LRFFLSLRAIPSFTESIFFRALVVEANIYQV
jgi:hypothetical protein